MRKLAISKVSLVEGFEPTARAFIASRGAPGTRELYTADFNKWLRHCEAEGIDPAAPVLVAAASFRDALQAAQKPLTVRRTLATLSSIYTFAIAADPERPRATCNPFAPVALSRPPARKFSRTEAFTETEAWAIIRAAEIDKRGARDEALLKLLYETGLRRTSVTRIMRRDLVMRDGATVIHLSVKAGRQVEIVVPESAAAAVSRWLATAPANDWLFPGRSKKGPILANVVNKIVSLRATQAGVEHAHPHRFRASYATAAFNAGIPLRDIQASMHHESPSTTIRYDCAERGSAVPNAIAKHRQARKEAAEQATKKDRFQNLEVD